MGAFPIANEKYNMTNIKWKAKGYKNGMIIKIIETN